MLRLSLFWRFRDRRNGVSWAIQSANQLPIVFHRCYGHGAAPRFSISIGFGEAASIIRPKAILASRPDMVFMAESPGDKSRYYGRNGCLVHAARGSVVAAATKRIPDAETVTSR
jgi:hypothetical protein